jgi:predicted dehydrogenase
MTLSALVVGLGQIGMGYDLSLNPAEYVLTHVRAFHQHPAYQLQGAVDLDPQKRAIFKSNYGVPAFATVDTAMAKVQPDVVAVATPTHWHAATMQEVLHAYAPKAILCEKPLAFDLSEAREMIQLASKRGCKVFVNYMRRAEPGVIEVKNRMSDGRIGSLEKGVVWYSKGLFNNGSHFLNLLQYWVGEVTDFQIVQPGRMWSDVDPEPDVLITFGSKRILFLAAKEENFSHYTVELLFSNGRLRYEQGGGKVIWQGVGGDQALAGYSVLKDVETCLSTDMDHVQWHVADQLASSLAGEESEICSAVEALRTIEVLASIKAKLG